MSYIIKKTSDYGLRYMALWRFWRFLPFWRLFANLMIWPLFGNYFGSFWHFLALFGHFVLLILILGQFVISPYSDKSGQMLSKKPKVEFHVNYYRGSDKTLKYSKNTTSHCFCDKKKKKQISKKKKTLKHECVSDFNQEDSRLVGKICQKTSPDR